MNDREMAARALCARLTAAGYRALLAGGYVRDLLLGRTPKDYDIATNATPAQIIRLFPHSVDIGAAFGVVMVVDDSVTFEVTTFRQDGPYLDGRRPSSVRYTSEEVDAQRRDFTINALFMDPFNNQILDYTGGLHDLRQGIIRAVGCPEDRFREDRLRMVRAIRFAARLGFSIEENTWRSLTGMAPLITSSISAERIRDELLKMLKEGGAYRAFRLLDQSGILGLILPEIAAMKGVEQPAEYHPEGDVFVHTLNLLRYLPKDTSTALAMAALLHDVGKPATQSFEDRIRFNFHDKAGALMAQSICDRLRLSRVETERVGWLVGQHMRLGALPAMREGRRRQFVAEPGFAELLDLCRMDCLASHGDLTVLDWIDAYLAQIAVPDRLPKPLLSGKDLLHMGYQAGPVFKIILEQVRLEQLEGKLQNTGAAQNYVRAMWPTGG